MRLIVTTCVFSACAYNAHFDDCAIRCTADTGCPDDLTCGSEGRCRPTGTIEACGDRGTDDGGVSDGECTNFADPIVDLAPFKSAEADEIRSAGEDASKANDEDETTRWSSADGTPGHWWLVDLGTNHLLTSVTTKWEYGGVNYEYYVSVSPDGTSFTTAIDETADTRVDQVRTDSFPDASCARFVRITKTDTTGYWAILYTVNVMGR